MTTPQQAELAITGSLLDESGRQREVDILIANEKIAGIVDAASGDARNRIDATGSFLLPGMVDAHVHSLSHAGEGIQASTSAAAAGGVTTIVEMPFDATGPINSHDRLEAKKEMASREALVDIALLGTSEPNGGWRRIDSLSEDGAVGLKVSLFDTDPFRFPRISDAELIDVFTAAAANEMPVCVHAENNEIIKALLEQLRADGDDPLAHCRSRPPVAETLGVLTALEIANNTGAKAHVCHASLPRSIDMVNLFASDGADVTVETCPHYLLFDQNDMKRQGGRLKINPPLRQPSDREGLWERLEQGKVSVISSDHAPWPIDFKTKPNIFDNHSGAPGVETIYPLLLAEAHRRGPRAFSAVVTATTKNPATRFGISDRKGQLAVGHDADIAVFDPNAEWTVDEETLHSNAGWSPYHGTKWQGKITQTFVRGRLAYDGELRNKPGDGQIVRRAR